MFMAFPLYKSTTQPNQQQPTTSVFRNLKHELGATCLVGSGGNKTKVFLGNNKQTTILVCSKKK